MPWRRFVKKIGAITFGLLGVLLSCLAHADTDTSQLKAQSELEAVMSNVSNQLIYAYFGKDILIYYLNDDAEQAVIEKTDEAQLAVLAQPFNAFANRIFGMASVMLYGVTFGYFMIRLLLYLAEHGFTLQREGTLKLTFKERRALLMKGVLVGALFLTPLTIRSELNNETYVASAATFLLFDFLGTTNQIADESSAVLIESQRQTLKTVTLPAAEAKSHAMQSLQDFYTCARLQSNRGTAGSYTASLPLIEDGQGFLKGGVIVGNCVLQLTLGIDDESDKLLRRIKAASPSLAFSDTLFHDAQQDVYQRLFSDLFGTAQRVSAELAKPDLSASWADADFSLKGHTSAALGVRGLASWPQRCEELEAWTSPSGQFISRQDRVYYHNLMARCQSKKIADALVYPHSYDLMAQLSNGGASFQRELALCVDQSVSTPDLLRNYTGAEYGLGSGGKNQDSAEQISLDSCLVDICSKSSLDQGGLYACSNVFTLYDERLRDLKMQQRGSMLLGFYMFDLFLHRPPSASAKRLFNGLDAQFSADGNIEASVGTPYLTLSVPIPPVSGEPITFGPILTDLGGELGGTQVPTIDVPLPEPTTLLSQVFGYTRLEACVKNPLQVYAGFVCGNVPQELNRFGMAVLHNAVALKLALTVGQTTGMMSRFKTSERGEITGASAHDFSSRATKMVAVGAVTMLVGSSSYVGELFDSTFGLEWLKTDEFGYLDTVKLDGLLGSVPAVVLASMAHAGADTRFITVVDGGLLTLLLLGIIFAFLLPLFPMLIVTSALIKFFYLLWKTIITQGFKLVDLLFDNDFDVLNEGLDRLWADWLALALKLPLLVVGVVLAWQMSNVGITHILNGMNLMVQTNDGVQGVFDLLISMLVVCVVIFIIYNTVLSVIETFYDMVVEWLLGSMHNNPFKTEHNAIGWQDARRVATLVGR